MTGRINSNDPIQNLPPLVEAQKKAGPPATSSQASLLLKVDPKAGETVPYAISKWPESKVAEKSTGQDIHTLLSKFNTGPQVEKIAVLMQDFMMQARKVARNLMYAENSQYVARMEQAKQSVEQQAVWALSGAAMAGISIVGAALNVVGAVKSARHDKAGVKGLENKIIKFTKENLGDADDGLDAVSLTSAIPRASGARASSTSAAGSVRRRASTAQDELDQVVSEAELQDISRYSDAARKQSPVQRVQQFAELEDNLSPTQQQVISQLRGALTNESTRILSRYQAASGIIEASGKMLSDTMHAMGTFEKATQIQFETAAGAAQFARGASEQMLSSFTDGVHKTQQRVASIVDSEADTRKHSIRA